MRNKLQSRSSILHYMHGLILLLEWHYTTDASLMVADELSKHFSQKARVIHAQWVLIWTSTEASAPFNSAVDFACSRGGKAILASY